jgi:protein-tyrosine phosphatase
MAFSLLSPLAMPAIEGIRIPMNFYVVLKEPALLAGMSYPRVRTPWEKIRNAGFSGIVCLCDSEVSYNPYPLEILFSAELEDLHYGNAPYDPDTQEWLVRKATNVIREEVDAGKGIVVHCMGGIGRTGTVLGCVLKDLGFQAEEVINYLDDVTKLRGFRGWPETKWQAEMILRY